MKIEYILRRIFSPILRLFAPGYSTCIRCKVPWKFTRQHTTNFTNKRGCFPLCEYCWKSLKYPAERLPFYWRFLLKSKQKGVYHGMDVSKEWEQMEEAVLSGK